MSLQDAFIVERLREQGALIPGIDQVLAGHELDTIIAPTGSPAW